MRAIVLGLLASTATMAARAGDLEVRRVMLSSAGVGYFEYEATVEGAASLGLDVKLDQVDDVLKSLVVFDSAGAVGAVELPGRDGSQAAFGRVPFGPWGWHRRWPISMVCGASRSASRDRGRCGAASSAPRRCTSPAPGRG